ncbi:MAG: NadR type nicotinamide-nucleotide adenylyltransferase [Crocinitomix sp.]|jgi:NadR type nicotinamide-nucleotide adenylyltransferase
MIRIAITGPESSGKTTLSRSLSEHFKVPFIPEFARTYLEKINGDYNQFDLDKIAQGQLKSILSSQNTINISDSDFSVLEIWSHYKYGNVSDFIFGLVKKDLFDLHILCTPDIPWEEDPLRENPDNRDQLFELYKESLIKHKKNFIVVSGAHKNRVEKCLETIDLLLKV